MRPSLLSPQSGIALGPILFVLAILAIIGTVMSAGGGGFNTASVADRVTADVVSQANLIRSKINECNLMYGTTSNYDGYPQDSTGGSPGVLVSSLNCTGDPATLQNLWTGNRAINLPPPTAGFGNWYYVNTNTGGLGGSATGGRCIYIQPNASSSGVVQGLQNATKRFTSNTTNDGSSEVNYNSSMSHQRFIGWITLPTGTANANCTPQ